MNKYHAHQNPLKVGPWDFVLPDSVTVTAVEGVEEESPVVHIPGTHKYVVVWNDKLTLNGEGFNTRLGAKIFQSNLQEYMNPPWVEYYGEIVEVS